MQSCVRSAMPSLRSIIGAGCGVFGRRHGLWQCHQAGHGQWLHMEGAAGAATVVRGGSRSGEPVSAISRGVNILHRLLFQPARAGTGVVVTRMPALSSSAFPLPHRIPRGIRIFVEGLIAMRLVIALGYDVENDLSEVIVFVKKFSEVIPDDWRSPARDVVGDMVRYLISAIAEEHDSAMHGDASYIAELEHPLHGRSYLDGAVQSWCLDDDLRAARNRW
ncbi:hypothetical protein CBR_g25800 [Chara braunii]|uniref:Uncharacterized protein n=1 Tax=Chara braunii TaxID=69332 RepID=A0A388L6G7_CHABU|nr:hypothetical protein CBR_g25800 [Chara braunii]|eukprot:GBG77868.1 hypothetical protein CBR_g25800 [Chara braunii]